MSDRNNSLDNPGYRRQPSVCVNKKSRFAAYVVTLVAIVGLLASSYSSASQIAIPAEIVSSDVNTNLAQGQKSESQAATAAAISVKSSASSDKSAGMATDTVKSQVTNGEVKTVNVASAVASSVNLSSSDNVENSAVSTNTTAVLAQSENSSASQVTTEEAETPKAITQYTVKEGDTVQNIAAASEVNEESIRWSNGLKDNNVAAGTVLNIPAVNGIVYTVKDGDTLQSIAGKYGSTADSIITMNDIKDDNVTTGEVILLPDGILPEEERPEYVAPAKADEAKHSTSAPSTATNALWSTGTSRGGNNYAYGYCTWYAYNRRVQLGLPVSGGWGNANTWDGRAAAQGYTVNHTPSVGAIFQTKSGYYGHVGIVERVNSDGSIYVSEMNYKGWDVKSYRTITSLSGYKFIH